MCITYSHFMSISINFGRLIYLQFYRQPLSFRITRCREKSSSRYDINFVIAIKKKVLQMHNFFFYEAVLEKKITKIGKIDVRSL